MEFEATRIGGSNDGIEDGGEEQETSVISIGTHIWLFKRLSARRSLPPSSKRGVRLLLEFWDASTRSNPSHSRSRWKHIGEVF